MDVGTFYLICYDKSSPLAERFNGIRQDREKGLDVGCKAVSCVDCIAQTVEFYWSRANVSELSDILRRNAQLVRLPIMTPERFAARAH